MHPSGKAIITLRLGSALVCNIVLHFILLSIFLFSTNVDPTAPLRWVRNVIGSYFSLGVCLYSLPLILVTLAQGVVSCREYLFPPPLLVSRFAVACSVFSVFNIVLGGLYAYIGFSIPLIYTSVLENAYSSFTFVCDSGVCLSEDRLYLLLGGAWVGFYYFVHNHLFNARYLNFPFLQQRKSIMIKSSILPTINSSFKYSVTPVFTFLIIYYLRGGWFRNFFEHLLSYKVQPGDLDSFLKLFSVERLFKFWLFSSVTIFTLKMMEVMIKISLMQRYEFSLFSTVGPSTTFILEDALGIVDTPIVRHLGFWDLALLSESDASRRKDVFTLSQPGGHPYSWRGIKKQCFNTINEFTYSLEQTLKKPKPLAHSVSPANIKQARLESTNYFASSKPDKPLFCTETFNFLLRFATQSVVNWMFTKLVIVGESRPVRYLFGNVQRFSVNHLLLHSLPVAWAAESLSLLLSASLTEDPYGVLQSDIPEVISTLLHLQAALDSLHKNPVILRKMHSPGSDPVSKMHNTLVNKVKRSLYLLAIHFRPYISDLQLPKSDELRLLAYCSFRE